MALFRLLWCVGGVYSMFLLWAIAQERLSVPFNTVGGKSAHRFRSAVFIGTCQSLLSALSALIYLTIRRKPNTTFPQMLGLEVHSPSAPNGTAKVGVNGQPSETKMASKHHTPRLSRSTSLLLRYLQCSLFVTCAAPFGFASLSYISYPAMVLGKSCKLVPVMLMNVILYRRNFAPHKYLVVAMVTIGITIFMGFGDEYPNSHAKSRHAPEEHLYANLIGCTYLLVNLILDGAVNSTQDEIFAQYRPTGQQMMFWMNLFCTLLSTSLSVLPLPYIPVIHPSKGGHSEFSDAFTFIKEHPSVVVPLVQFAFTGALGQLFIYETLQHFGSLTLVTITLTRKMFTMMLSVIVYNHKLTPGQWLGAATVFSGISVEAYVKRKDIHAKRVIQEKEKAKIKSL